MKIDKENHDSFLRTINFLGKKSICLDAHDADIHEIEYISDEVNQLYISCNDRLTNIACDIPTNVTDIYAYACDFEIFPKIPDTVRTLLVYNNAKLHTITNISEYMEDLVIADCNISELPPLPETLKDFFGPNNPFSEEYTKYHNLKHPNFKINPEWINFDEHAKSEIWVRKLKKTGRYMASYSHLP